VEGNHESDSVRGDSVETECRHRGKHKQIKCSSGGREVQGQCEDRRCSLKSWVFKSFLKIDLGAPVLVALGMSFHHHGTTHEKSLDCH